MESAAFERIDEVIQAHSAETSLDELRAQGKERVRVVSGRRVMELIRALVEDSLGEPGSAARDVDPERVALDVRTRLDRVLQVQTELERTVADLRAELREAEIERTRLRSERDHLLRQGRAEVDEDVGGPFARLARDVEHVRTTVDDLRGRGEATARVHERALDAVLDCVADSLRRSEQDLAKRLEREFGDVRRRLAELGTGVGASVDPGDG